MCVWRQQQERVLRCSTRKLKPHSDSRSVKIQRHLPVCHTTYTLQNVMSHPHRESVHVSVHDYSILETQSKVRVCRTWMQRKRKPKRTPILDLDPCEYCVQTSVYPLNHLSNHPHKIFRLKCAIYMYLNCINLNVMEM